MKKGMRPREFIPLALLLGVFIYTAFFTGQFTYGQFSQVDEAYRLLWSFGLAGLLTATYAFMGWVRDEYPEFKVATKVVMLGITFLGVMGATSYLQQTVQENVNDSGEATEVDRAIAREDSLSDAWKDAAAVNEEGRYWALVRSAAHSKKADSLRLERKDLNITGAGAENALYMQMAKWFDYDLMTISLVRNALFSVLLDYVFALLMRIWLRMRRDRLGGSRRVRKKKPKILSRFGGRRKSSPPPKGSIVPGNPIQSENVKIRIQKLREFLANFDGEPSMKEMMSHLKVSENTVRKYLKIISDGGSG
jgi:hypothetical protein